MNSAPQKSMLAEEQASLWAARLDGSVLTAADRAELDAWLEADPSHRALLSSFCQFSADLEQQLPLLAGIRDELAENLATAKTASPHPWLRWPTLAGATLMVAAALTVILWQGRPQNQFQHISTPVAQRQEITLADGSQVELNAQTTLVVELTAAARRVRLAGGEAFFRVSADQSRPFHVETPAGLIRVTGTQFNVRTDAVSALEVTVLEGTVQVQPGENSEPQSLEAGHKLVRDATRVTRSRLSSAQLDDALAWRQGQIVLDGTPLREALSRFARYHGRSITVSDDAGRQRVGGRRSLDDLDGFLSALPEVLPTVRVTRAPDGSIHVEEIRRN